MSTIKTTLKRWKYDEEFKAEVLKMLESRQSVPWVSQAPGISENILYRWQSQQQAHLSQQAKGEPSELGPQFYQETILLKQKVKQLEMDREI